MKSKYNLNQYVEYNRGSDKILGMGQVSMVNLSDEGYSYQIKNGDIIDEENICGSFTRDKIRKSRVKKAKVSVENVETFNIG